MKVEVSMTSDKEEFYAHSWWAKDAAFVIHTLRSQLNAAATVWPELEQYQLAKKRSRSKKAAASQR